MTLVRPVHLCRGLLWHLLPLLFLAAPAQAAPKTDILVFRNGDRLTGEIKGLDRGKLSFNTDATGTIGIEWEDVARLVSTQYLQVETDAGGRYYGQLGEPAAEGKLGLVADDGPEELSLASVVRMAPIESGWFDRLDGDISAGYSMVSANDQTQFNFALDSEYRTEKILISLVGNATTTSGNEIEDTRRGTLTLQTNRLLRDRWFTGALASIERNDELGIDRRLSVGGGGGRFLRQTNSQVWRAQGGVLYTWEKFLDATGIEDSGGSEGSLEGFAALTFDWFHFDEPELDFSTRLTLFPSLTESGRWRGSYNVSLKWEIYNDFFWRLSLDGDYDNQSRDPEASDSDYTLNTSLGWEF